MAQQYSMKKMMELFGDKDDAAITRERNQINDFETYMQIKAINMSWEDKMKALESLIFMIEKRNGDIKARKVADRNKQRLCDEYDRSDGSSPTGVMESIFITGATDSKEKREVAALDTPNALLQAFNNKTINKLLRGTLYEMMIRIDPALYREYTTYSVQTMCPCST